MDRMRRWLEELALGQYAEVLADNDIDFEVLPELGDRGPQGASASPSGTAGSC